MTDSHTAAITQNTTTTGLVELRPLSENPTLFHIGTHFSSLPSRIVPGSDGPAVAVSLFYKLNLNIRRI